MYKLLLILLFVIGLSNNYDNIIQSEVDLRTKDIETDINSILDISKYRIEVNCDVRVTIIVKKLIEQDGSGFFFENGLASIILNLEGEFTGVGKACCFAPVGNGNGDRVHLRRYFQRRGRISRGVFPPGEGLLLRHGLVQLPDVGGEYRVPGQEHSPEEAGYKGNAAEAQEE